MKITKSQLKEIIKTELNLFEIDKTSAQFNKAFNTWYEAARQLNKLVRKTKDKQLIKGWSHAWGNAEDAFMEYWDRVEK